MISYESAKAALDDIVNKAGLGYRLEETCKYVDSDDKPLCIVGKYLVEYCNVPVGFFRGSPGSAVPDNSKNFRTLRPKLTETFGLNWDDRALRFLGHAQTKQDEGRTWSSSVAYAAEYSW